MTKAKMVQLTAPGVRETTITMALCRIFKQGGYSAAPLLQNY